MKYETFDQPAYGVGDLETFGITDNSVSLVIDYSSGCGMESLRDDSILTRSGNMSDDEWIAMHDPGSGSDSDDTGGGGGGGGSDDDDDNSTNDSSGDTSGNGDTGSGDDEEVTTYEYVQGYNQYGELIASSGEWDDPELVADRVQFAHLDDYSSMIDSGQVIGGMQESYYGENPFQIRHTFVPDPDSFDCSLNEPLDQNDYRLSSIDNMASDGCNFRTYQMAAEYYSDRNLSPKDIQESVELLQKTPSTLDPEKMVLSDNMRVNSPNQVIDDAFDRLGMPEITGTVGHGGNGEEPDFYRESGKTELGERHHRLLTDDKKLLNDPYSPDRKLSGSKLTGIWIHEEENEK